jgi:Tfp pilus assembly protein FimT
MSRTAGVTLFEVVAGLALAATVTGIGAARLPVVVGPVRLTGAAERLAAALRLARGQALARNRRIEVRFDPPRRSWSLHEEGGPPLETHALPAGIVFSALPSALRVRFGTTGTADNATVVLASGPRSRRVVVNQRGRVQIQ